MLKTSTFRLRRLWGRSFRSSGVDLDVNVQRTSACADLSRVVAGIFFHRSVEGAVTCIKETVAELETLHVEIAHGMAGMFTMSSGSVGAPHLPYLHVANGGDAFTKQARSKSLTRSK